MYADSSDVQFDFAGSLRLARMMWEFADELERALDQRRELADVALADWLGSFADNFGVRADNEQLSRQNLVPALRGNAQMWADAWRDATNDQARREWARRVDQMKADRSNLQKFGDFFTGFDYPPEPVPVTSPQPPGFMPVCGVG